MNQHYLVFQNPENYDLFQAIADGKKTIDARPFDLNNQSVQPGNLIHFQNSGRTITCEVLGVRKYKDSEAYFKKEGLQKTVPGVRTREKAVGLYNQLFNPAEREHLCQTFGYGVVAFEFKVVKMVGIMTAIAAPSGPVTRSKTPPLANTTAQSVPSAAVSLVPAAPSNEPKPKRTRKPKLTEGSETLVPATQLLNEATAGMNALRVSDASVPKPRGRPRKTAPQ